MSPEGIKAMHDQIQALQSQLQEARASFEDARVIALAHTRELTYRGKQIDKLQAKLAEALAIVERQYNTIIRLNDKWEASEAEVEKLQGENGKLKAEVAEMTSIANNAHRLISLRERQLERAKEAIIIFNQYIDCVCEFDKSEYCAEYFESAYHEKDTALIEIEALKLEANKSGSKS